jgi:hypothetical protein
VALRTRTYILEHTRDFFTRQPDEVCSGTARLERTDSRAAPIRIAASTVALRSPDCLGADPPTTTTGGVGAWPPSAMGET